MEGADNLPTFDHPLGGQVAATFWPGAKTARRPRGSPYGLGAGCTFPLFLPAPSHPSVPVLTPMKILRPLLLALSLLLPARTVAHAADSIVSEGVIDAPVATVWKAWTTADGLKSWMAPLADIDLRLDGLMRANYNAKGSLDDAATIHNRILAFEPERLLSIRVAQAPEKFPFKADIGAMWTVLYFTPTAEGKTHLRVVGLGFGPGESAQKMKAFFQQGNDYTVALLQKHFQPGAAGAARPLSP